MKQMILKPSRLTGDDVASIRKSFDMTLKDFAKACYVTHPAVIKWEKHGSNWARIGLSTEKMLRLEICSKLILDGKMKESEFEEVFNKLTFGELADKIRKSKHEQ